eukprot:10445027-Alexandrium_andersonii.AAC.1
MRAHALRRSESSSVSKNAGSKQAGTQARGRAHRFARVRALTDVATHVQERARKDTPNALTSVSVSASASASAS